MSARLPLLVATAAVIGVTAAACACGGKPDPGPPAVDEPSVLDDYIAITERLAAIAEAHPDDRVAAGQAMAAFYDGDEAAHAKTVARMRELYLADLSRDQGDRMPDRWPDRIAHMRAVAERFAVFIQGPPYLLRDEVARRVVKATAMSSDYAEIIEDRWEEFGAEAEAE